MFLGSRRVIATGSRTLRVGLSGRADKEKGLCIFILPATLPFLKRGVNNNNQTFFSHFWEERSQRYEANTNEPVRESSVHEVSEQVSFEANSWHREITPNNPLHPQRPRACCWVSAALSGDDDRSDNFLGSGNIFIPHQTQYVWDIMLSIWWAY